MKCKIIVFGAFLSTFILILVPSIGSVNANIQNENNLNIKNINIDDIKTIINRLKDTDCNCQKTTGYNNNKLQDPLLLCLVLLNIVFITLLPFILISGFEKLEALYEKILVIAWTPIGMLADFLDCWWRQPPLE